MNEWMRRTGETLPGKVTATALERTIRGEVPYYFDDIIV
jgi:hypothetical protein